MAGDDPEESGAAAADRDAFIVQLEWIRGHYGSWKELAETSKKVSERTLIGWANGEFPKSNSSPAVTALHRWAEATLRGYPQAAGVPALTETSGRRRLGGQDRADPAAATDPPSPDDTDAPADPERGEGRRRRWSRTRVAVATVAVVLLAVVTLVVVVWVRSTDPPAVASPDPTGTAEPTGTTAGPPTGPPGASTPETTGTIGAKTFGDPFQLSDPRLPIPPETTVDVRCRLYAPSIGSVQPDGYWYLVLTSPWSERWAPANSFLNGDRLGGPTEHNTDFDVPECE